jgi:hypothetical protein
MVAAAGRPRLGVAAGLLLPWRQPLLHRRRGTGVCGRGADVCVGMAQVPFLYTCGGDAQAAP